MKNIVYPILFIFLFYGCSFKTAANHSQIKTTNAFSSYTNNFLSANNLMAKNDLRRAVKYAKTDANLNSLARIYLGECALNISVGLNNNCNKYKNIKELVDDKSLYAYYNLITLNLKQKQLNSLPEKYKKFATYLLLKKFDKAYNEAININSATSQMLLSSLIKKHLNKTQIKEIIKIASYNGYKKSVLFWLNELRNITKNKKIKKNISKRISILKSNSF
jgi:hypothetical protein